MGSWPAGFYPFWFWNDTLCADEIEWQVREMAAQGIRGFFIRARQGLGQPYLSERFMQMVDAAVAAAEAQGLSVHLYDEYPYPSGIAGGEVALGSPEFHATRLIQRSFDSVGRDVRLQLPRGKVLACQAYRLRDGRVDWEDGLDLRRHVGMVLTRGSYVETGLTAYNRKRFFASDPVPVLEAELPPGQHRLFATVQAEVDHHKYWGHYVDVLSPEAVRRFIDLTHEQYRARYGHRFGSSILSIFTDEVRPDWSARVPGAFEAAYGYDLCAMLPALQDESHPRHLQVRADLSRLLYRMFCASFEEPISTWCGETGLAYTGEKPSLRMSQLRYMDVPGCEPGHTKVGAVLDLLQPHLRGNAKATASAAYFYGKRGALCECYHSTGWSATLQDAKYIADALLLMGIRYLVPHIDFHVVDIDILESARIEDGHVHVADITAQAVVIPPMRVIEAPLEHWLDRYQAQGGRVVWCDRDERTVDLTSMVRDTAKPSLSAKDGTGEATDILSVKRIGPRGTLWYLLHTGDLAANVELDAGMPLREVALGPNAVPGLRLSAGRYMRTVAPYEAFMIAASESPEPAHQLPRATVHLGGQAALEIAGCNLLRLGKWHLSLLDERRSPGPAAVVSPVPLPNQLERGQLAFVPAYAEYFGHVPEVSLPTLTVRYEHTFACAYDGRVWLLVEPDSIVSDWRISLNAGLIVQDDLSPIDAHCEAHWAWR